MEIYNVHIHTFKNEDVPRKFLPLNLVRVLSTKTGFNVISKILNTLNPLSSDDKFKKYVKFATTGKLKSQEEIFDQCAEQYPEKTKFIVMAIDMSAMNAGNVPRPYIEQLRELIELKNKYPNKVIPFVHIEPNNPDYLNIFDLAMKMGFKGVKLYPPASCFLPTDERLTPIYEYCNENNIPILVHCGEQSPTHYRDSKKNLRKKLNEYGLKWTKNMNRVQLCGQFTHPENYIEILKKYPNINLCLGHWGSEKAWDEYLEDPNNDKSWFNIIKDMIKKYPNLYTDVSFTLNRTEYFSILKIFLLDKSIKPKVLFGSDYYMVETKTTEKKFCFDLRAFLGEDLWKAISYTNPKKYLKF
jgi:predicted TIM-barrel fold metal-dependent hydrolase